VAFAPGAGIGIEIQLVDAEARDMARIGELLDVRPVRTLVIALKRRQKGDMGDAKKRGQGRRGCGNSSLRSPQPRIEGNVRLMMGGISNDFRQSPPMRGAPDIGGRRVTSAPAA
jgi:hypothetical protein